MNSYAVNTIPVSNVKKQSAIILTLHESITPSTYEEIITTVKSYLATGHTHLVVEMLGVPRLNLTTLFTLYSLVALAKNQQPANPEGGWNAIYTMADAFVDEPVSNMNVCAVQPNVAQALRQGGFADVVEIFSTLGKAVNAFNPVCMTAVAPTQNRLPNQLLIGQAIYPERLEQLCKPCYQQVFLFSTIRILLAST
ncbi:hypothetical protein [Candidatus Leptofilum sp.]|uniref:hypothetical protein n=1 Tax=Candidatus Leptofilum sp. TaxID=3241576 RepID=UPI003B58C01E